nr:MAG TPA: hypothetical protein [Caudoviricetes sp.]
MKPPNRPATITTSIHSISSPPYAICFSVPPLATYKVVALLLSVL